MNRYDGKPLIKILECYVLDAINALDSASSDGLKKMEPKLSDIYGVNGTWKEILVTVMQFPESMPDQIRTFWEGYSAAASKQGLPANPNAFSTQFVDQNFSNL